MKTFKEYLTEEKEQLKEAPASMKSDILGGELDVYLVQTIQNLEEIIKYVKSAGKDTYPGVNDIIKNINKSLTYLDAAIGEL